MSASMWDANTMLNALPAPIRPVVEGSLISNEMRKKQLALLAPSSMSEYDTMNGGCYDLFRISPAVSSVAPRRTRDRGMWQQSPVAVGDAESGNRGRAELSQRPSFVHGYRRFQQATVTRATHEHRCDVVRRINQWHVRGKHKPGRYGGPERVGAMRARIHGNGYDSRGSGIFPDDEPRLRLAAQDLRSRTVDVPVSATSFLAKTLHFSSLSHADPKKTRSRHLPTNKSISVRRLWPVSNLADGQLFLMKPARMVPDSQATFQYST